MKFKIDFTKTNLTGFEIDPNCVDFSRYKQNPIITHVFDSAHPIALVENIKIENGVLTADIQFDKDFPQKAIDIYTNFLAKEGLIQGNPGGFIESDGTTITKFELIEVSI